MSNIAFALWCVVFYIILGFIIVGGVHAQPVRHARPAHRLVYWVCPIDQAGNPVTKPDGVCFHEFWGH